MACNSVLFPLLTFCFMCSVESLLSNLNQYTNKHLPEIHEFQSCVPGHLYKADCNTCRCSKNSTLLCTKMACVDKAYIQTMKNHIEKHQKHIKAKWAKAIGRSGRDTLQDFPELEENEDCVPGRFYKKSCETCFCNDIKALNCTGKCEDRRSFKSSRPVKTFPFKPEEIQYFDVLSHLSDKCVPGKMYRIACNGCLCQEANDLICENKLCVSHEGMSRLEAKQRSGRQCSEDETRGCVKCKCVNKTSKCKAVPKCDERERLSGNYFKVPLALNLQKEKCIPGMMYTVQCNQCYCQPDSTLRCTQKACLNYAQVIKLHKKRIDLEQHGL